jgi:hypothetical protein
VSPRRPNIYTRIEDDFTVYAAFVLVRLCPNLEGGYKCGGCFFGGNETSDAGESLIRVGGFIVILSR